MTGQTSAITIRAATVGELWNPMYEIEFLEMQELERALLEQFLAQQVNIAA